MIIDNTNETIADIVRDLRNSADSVEDDAHDEDAWTNTEAAWIYRDIADRIEAASQREREARAPKPDPNWKDICAMCNDGDIEPRFCKYYGEPNGCNSPIYGEHPTNEKSAGNAAEEGGAE